MSKEIKYAPILEQDERSFIFDHVKIYREEQITIHQQKTWELSYVIIGGGSRVIGDTIESFSRGEVILIPPGIPHCWSFDASDLDQGNQIENITLTFTPTFLRNCAITFPELQPYLSEIENNKGAISFQGEVLKQLQQAISKMSQESDLERISSIIKLLLLIASSNESLLVGEAIEEDKMALRMQKVQLYIMNHYHRTITLAEIAHYVGLDKSSFCIFFKKMNQKTFLTYLTEYRLEVACQMIRKTDKTISEICFASGFKDVPYFNRVFKKKLNATPTTYRQRYISTSL